MIIDKLENAHLYYPMHELFEKAFEFVKNNDLTKLESGDHEVIGRDLFVRIKKYNSFPLAECKLETHEKYAEFHICLSGKEWFCYGHPDTMKPVDKIEEKDMYYFDGKVEPITLEGDTFILAMPSEGHMPERAIDEIPEPIVKAVVKMRIR